jgi:hypothetical protein
MNKPQLELIPSATGDGPKDAAKITAKDGKVYSPSGALIADLGASSDDDFDWNEPDDSIVVPNQVNRSRGSVHATHIRFLWNTQTSAPLDRRGFFIDRYACYRSTVANAPGAKRRADRNHRLHHVVRRHCGRGDDLEIAPVGGRPLALRLTAKGPARWGCAGPNKAGGGVRGNVLPRRQSVRVT